MRKKEEKAMKRILTGKVVLSEDKFVFADAFRLVVDPYEQMPKTLSEALSENRPSDYILYLGAWKLLALARHASLESGGVHKVPKDYNGPYKRYDLSDEFNKLTCKRYFYIEESEVF